MPHWAAFYSWFVTHRDLQTVLQGVGARSTWLVRKVLGWLMDSGRLLEYRLARRLELETVADQWPEANTGPLFFCIVIDSELWSGAVSRGFYLAYTVRFPLYTSSRRTGTPL